jgi:hypothetical protein
MAEGIIKRCFHAPGDAVAKFSTARDRRSTAVWLFLIYTATLPLRYPYKDRIWLIWALSEGAMMFSLLAVGAAETPAEEEE